MSAHLCPYCKQTSIVPSLASATEEANPTTEQVQRLEETITLLIATRAKLLQRMNGLQSPPNKLPPEVLSMIFSYVSPPFDFSAPSSAGECAAEVHRQIPLGAVSSYWRQTVLSTPRLWATAVIYVKPGVVGLKANLLELYLKNVQGVPFSLELHLLQPEFPEWLRVFRPIFRAIKKGEQKFTLLNLSTLPQAWLPLLSPFFRNLEDLRLNWAWSRRGIEGPALQVSQLSSIPSLRRAYIEECPIGWTPPDWHPCHNITILHLVLIPLPTCVQLLLSCPNLIEYRCEQCDHELETPVPEDYPFKTVTFHNMRFFQAPYTNVLPFGEILYDLIFPVLETFSFEVDTGTDRVHNLLVLIQRLPVTCSTLEIRGSFTQELISQIVRVIPPHLQSLHLPDAEAGSFATLLWALRRDTTAGSFNMPGLRHIRMKTIYWKCNPTPTSGGAQDLFLSVLSARKELLDGRFVLEVGSDDGTDWIYMQNRLRRVVSGGFRLEILVSGTLIPELRKIYEVDL